MGIFLKPIVWNNFARSVDYLTLHFVDRMDLIQFIAGQLKGGKQFTGLAESGFSNDHKPVVLRELTGAFVVNC